jgi:acetoin utilization protein AcuB
MTIERIMSSRVVSVEMDDKLSVVKEIFDKLRFHHVLVIEGGKLVGVVSDRDLLKALSPRLGTLSESGSDSATLNKRVHQIMSRKPITLRSGASLMDAVQVFTAHRISCIPIVDHDDMPIGILSWRDLLKGLAEKLPRQSVD